MRTSIRHVLAGLMLAALVALSGGASVAAPWGSSGGPATTAPIDLVFIDMMIPHHESAIAMAHVALTKGEHQEVRDLAQAIIRTQQAELAQLRAWRDQWFPNAANVTMDQMSSMMHDPTHAGAVRQSDEPSMVTDEAGELHALTNAEGPFDRTFLRLMIPHHLSAVTMARNTVGLSSYPEIKRLAQAVIDGQGQEITQMRGWLATWYGEGAIA